MEGEGAGVITGIENGEKFDGCWEGGDGEPISGVGRWLSEEGYENMYDGEWKLGKGKGPSLRSSKVLHSTAPP